MAIIYLILLPLLIAFMLGALISLSIYYWFHRMRYFKTSNELSLWSIFDCRHCSFCNKVLSNNGDDTVLRGHIRTYIMITNLWTYIILTVYFIMILIGSSVSLTGGNTDSSPLKPILCRNLSPFSTLTAWCTAYALQEYFLLRSLELHVSLDRNSQFWKKLNLIAFYLICILQVILFFDPPRLHMNEKNQCVRSLNKAQSISVELQRDIIVILMFVSWALFAEPLFSLKRAVSSMGTLSGDMAKEQQQVKSSIDKTVYRTSITSIVAQIIFVATIFLLQSDDDPNRDYYLATYVVCFALLTLTINLSYNDFGQRCCPLYYYYLRIPINREPSNVYAGSISIEKGIRPSSPTAGVPSSMDLEVSSHATLEAKSPSSTTEPRVEGSPPPQKIPI